MAYFIWVQFSSISWRNQSTKRDNNLHTFVHSKHIRTYISWSARHSLSLSPQHVVFPLPRNQCTEDSVLLNLLLRMLQCLCSLFLLRTEVFLTAGLFCHNCVWFQLAMDVFTPWSLFAGQRYPGDGSVKAADLLADFPRKRWILWAHPAPVKDTDLIG